MHLEDSVRQSVLAHPSLYLARTWKESRMLVLHQYFLVGGNGMKWAKRGDRLLGYLTHPIYTQRRYASEDGYARRRPDPGYGWPKIPALPWEALVAKARRDEQLRRQQEGIHTREKEMYRIFQEGIQEIEKLAQSSSEQQEWVRSVRALMGETEDTEFRDGNRLPYPLSPEYWPYAKIDPVLIKPDWREGMIEVFAWAQRAIADDAVMRADWEGKPHRKLKKDPLENYRKVRAGRSWPVLLREYGMEGYLEQIPEDDYAALDRVNFQTHLAKQRDALRGALTRLQTLP